MSKQSRPKNNNAQEKALNKLEGTIGGGIRPPKKRREYDSLPSFLRAYFRHLQRYIVTGLLVWVPMMVTIWVVWWFINSVGGGLNGFVAARVQEIRAVGGRVSYLSFLQAIEYRPWIGFLFGVLLFLTTGFLARYIVGRQIIAAIERVITTIPFVRGIYNAAQQIRDVFMNREGGVFQEVVLLEYPRPGVWSVGFVTSKSNTLVQEKVGENFTAVFMPTTPNPTTGFLMFFPDHQLIRLSISVEDAMKLIVSAGAFQPNALPESVTEQLPFNVD